MKSGDKRASIPVIFFYRFDSFLFLVVLSGIASDLIFGLVLLFLVCLFSFSVFPSLVVLAIQIVCEFD